MHSANWIWTAEADKINTYNRTARFFREFEVEAPEVAQLWIAADSQYRVYVNGAWVGDGPARSFPEHRQHDVLDIAPFLKPGQNRIEVTVRYFGCGFLRGIPQQPGLLAEIHLQGAKRKWQVFGTDTSWQAAPDSAWIAETPEISVQMEPVEYYDARLEGALEWLPAVALPERDTTTVPRNTPLLTRSAKAYRSVHSAVRLAPQSPAFCVPVVRLVHGTALDTSHFCSRPLVLTALLEVEQERLFNFNCADWKVALGGRLLEDAQLVLAAGRHRVLFFSAAFYGLHNQCPVFPFRFPEGARWQDWQAGVFEDLIFRDNDLVWLCFSHPKAEALEGEYFRRLPLVAAAGAADCLPAGIRWLELPEERIFLPDASADFEFNGANDCHCGFDAY